MVFQHSGGRDFDLPRHSHYSGNCTQGLSLWCFNIVACHRPRVCRAGACSISCRRCAWLLFEARDRPPSVGFSRQVAKRGPSPCSAPPRTATEYGVLAHSTALRVLSRARPATSGPRGRVDRSIGGSRPRRARSKVRYRTRTPGGDRVDLRSFRQAPTLDLSVWTLACP